MPKIDKDSETEETMIWYLPHIEVTNKNKPSLIRFVFDAATKSKVKCFNDFLIKELDLHNSLLSIMWKFRWETSLKIFVSRKYRCGNLLNLLIAFLCPLCENKSAMQFKDIYPDAVKGIVSKHYIKIIILILMNRLWTERLGE